MKKAPLAVRLAEEELWRQVMAGELTGLSTGGSGEVSEGLTASGSMALGELLT